MFLRAGRQEGGMKGKAVRWAKCSRRIRFKTVYTISSLRPLSPRTDMPLQVSGARGVSVMDDFRFRAFRFFPFVFLMLF